jgi:hypothetical protein
VRSLAALNNGEKRTYVRQALKALVAERAHSGLPHWIIVDEAHLLALDGDAPGLHPGFKGLCLVTYRPEQLERGMARDFDAVVFLADGNDLSLAQDRRFRGLLVQRGVPSIEFRMGERVSSHVRHWHKYLHAQLPPHLRFSFRDPTGVTGRSAANVSEFYLEVERSAPEVLVHHLGRHDFSRWVGSAVQDARLAAALQDIEAAGNPVESSRAEILRAIQSRYGEPEVDEPVRS